MDEYRLNMLPPEFLRPAAWINSGEVEFESLLFTVQNNTTQVRKINSLLLFPVVVQLNIIQAPDKLLFNVFQCRGRWWELDIYLKNILGRREILNTDTTDRRTKCKWRNSSRLWTVELQSTNAAATFIQLNCTFNVSLCPNVPSYSVDSTLHGFYRFNNSRTLT